MHGKTDAIPIFFLSLQTSTACIAMEGLLPAAVLGASPNGAGIICVDYAGDAMCSDGTYIV